jgi:hypothetical protein
LRWLRNRQARKGSTRARWETLDHVPPGRAAEKEHRYLSIDSCLADVNALDDNIGAPCALVGLRRIPCAASMIP